MDLTALASKASSDFRLPVTQPTASILAFAISTRDGRIALYADAAGKIVSSTGTSARAVSAPFAATITPNSATTDVLNVGVLTANLTVANPIGIPSDGQKVTMRFQEDGTGGWTISWGSSYAFGTDVTAALVPSTANAKWEMCFQWNATDSKWRAVAIARGF